MTLLFLAALGCSSGVFAEDSADTTTPEERMNRRFPQNVLVGDLLGDPLIDDDNRTLGHVEKVVRTPAGKVVLVTTVGSWLGLGGHAIGVPLETVGILGRSIAVLDISRKDFLSLPTWHGAETTPISPGETIRIALTRR